MNKVFIKIITIFWKDMLTELRTKEVVVSVFVFALLVIVIFNFAFGDEANLVETAAHSYP